MTAPEHNPLPWRIDRSGVIRDAFGNLVNVNGALKDQLENGRLIVTAVNAHAEPRSMPPLRVKREAPQC